jgi:hypothetical protein
MNNSEKLQNIINDIPINQTKEISLPIKKIHDINVQCTMTILNNNDSINFLIHIYLTDYEKYINNDNQKFCGFHNHFFYIKKELTDYSIVFTDIKNCLSKLSWCKYKGGFVTCNITTTDYNFFDELIPEIPIIEKIYDICCVCHEYTNEKTGCCNKSLCILCYIKLKKRKCKTCIEGDDFSCESYQCERPACPCCRKCLYDNDEFDSYYFD